MTSVSDRKKLWGTAKLNFCRGLRTTGLGVSRYSVIIITSEQTVSPKKFVIGRLVRAYRPDGREDNESTSGAIDSDFDFP